MEPFLFYLDDNRKQEVSAVLTIVNEANAMAEEMHKKVKFDVVEDPGTKMVMVRMTSLINANEWCWPMKKAIYRRSLMQKLYEDFKSNDGHLPDLQVNINVMMLPCPFMGIYLLM